MTSSKSAWRSDRRRHNCSVAAKPTKEFGSMISESELVTKKAAIQLARFDADGAQNCW